MTNDELKAENERLVSECDTERTLRFELGDALDEAEALLNRVQMVGPRIGRDEAKWFADARSWIDRYRLIKKRHTAAANHTSSPK